MIFGLCSRVSPTLPRFVWVFFGCVWASPECVALGANDSYTEIPCCLFTGLLCGAGTPPLSVCAAGDERGVAATVSRERSSLGTE